MNILIIGCNGFIGSHLSKYIIKNTPWKISGIDLNDCNITSLIDNPNFKFNSLDFTENPVFISSEVSKCDVVIPLAAIATPKNYIDNPLKVFELDFEANLSIIRECVKYKKRLIFPSTSEVYGLSEDEFFDEENTRFVLGPINKSRWIYSCSKQLLDRVIWAYKKENLNFTIFRPFNWVGPNLDDIHSKEKNSRVITQFIGNIMRNEPIELVDGGEQKRSFTDVRDGIDALIKIIENEEKSNHEILNIGNPDNEFSIKELASIIISEFQSNERLKHLVKNKEINSTCSELYYGEGYQDVNRRVPNVGKINSILNWNPKYTLQESISFIVDDNFKKGVFNG